MPIYFFSLQFLKYGLVIFFNVTMWGCYVNSLKALSSLQATVTNFATNFLSSGLAGYFIFEEPLPSRVTNRTLFSVHMITFLTTWISKHKYADKVLFKMHKYLFSCMSIKLKHQHISHVKGLKSPCTIGPF